MNRLIRRTLYAGSAACCGALLWGASASAADDDGGGDLLDQVQTAVVGNTTDQGADASILNRQININAPIAVLSPDANGGDVSQSNASTNTASATNDNATDQSVEQDQAAAATSGNGGSADVAQDQSATVDNGTEQQADASVENEQVNMNLPVAVLSPHTNGGDVSQSNEAVNTGEATNVNATVQDVDQAQQADATATDGAKGGGWSGDHGAAPVATVVQDQVADVSNETHQEATAPVANEQSNSNVSAAPEHHAPAGHDPGCGCDGDHGKGSPYGKDGGHGTPRPEAGDVTQSNEAVNTGEATNRNATEQDVEQAQQAEALATGGDNGHDGHGKDSGKDQGKGHDAAPVADVTQDQVADVWNGTEQVATAPIVSDQSNSNEPADHKGGKDHGDKDRGQGGHDGKGQGGKDGDHGTPRPEAGDVTQSNEAVNTAEATNRNATEQAVRQDQAGAATALAPDFHDRKGHDPKGDDLKGHDSKGHDGKGHDPKGHDSKGHDPTGHDGKRPHGVKGGGCEPERPHHDGRPSGRATLRQAQTADVSNGTRQVAGAPVDNRQENTNRGPSGDVEQSNKAANAAGSTNGNRTSQDVRQDQLATALSALIR